jgi:cell division transport system ATP-binding protein
MSQTIIQLSGISIYHGKNLILSNIDLNVNPGEFVYLIGKTGSGKSSFIKTLYADLPLVEGSGTVVDFELKNLLENKIPYLRRKIGVVFQDFQLLPDRSIYDNLLFVLKATGWKNKARMKDKIDSVLDKTGMKTKAFKLPHQLSGGEQQRVSIARALLNDPELIIADEPTGNLDPQTSIEIMRLLKEINGRGKTIIMATHDYSLIQRFPARTIKCENNSIFEVVQKNG